MMADWTGIFVVVGVAVLVFVLKYLIIRCYVTACGRNSNRIVDDPGSNRDGAGGGGGRNSMIIGLGPSTSILVDMRPGYAFNSSSLYHTYYSSAEFIETRNQNRLAAMRGRKPPPKFENALKCSTPVTISQLADDEPPPTYEEYLTLRRASELQTDLTSIFVVPNVHQSPQRAVTSVFPLATSDMSTVNDNL